MSAVESVTQIIAKFNEAFNRHDVEGMMRLTSEDTVFENTSPAPDGTKYSGKKAVAEFWRNFFREAPHAQIEIEEIFGNESRCVMRWKYDWGDGHIRGVDIFTLKGGLIAEKLSYVKG